MTDILTLTERLARQRTYDGRPCTSCGHRCVSHGSFDHDGGFAGIGMADCAVTDCECRHFGVAS